MAAPTIARTPIVNDDSSLTLGTVFEDAWKQEFYNQIDAVIAKVLASAAAGLVEGRLTASAGVPVPSSDVLAATAIKFTPYRGNRIGLYDGSAWQALTFTELSLSLGSDAANKNYDLFAFISGGAVAIERLAWTNDTTRATGLTTQDGILVKSGDATRRYLGTYRTTGTVGQTEDSYAKRFVWNYYNRVRRAMHVVDTADSWTYQTATYRQANANAANQLAVVVGWQEVMIDVAVQAQGSNNAGSVNLFAAIGEDSTTAKHADCQTGFAAAAANIQVAPVASLRTMVPLGYHVYTRLELSGASGTTTWLGDNGGSVTVTGISGALDG